MTEEKIGFFKRFITSIKDFEKYQIFATEKIEVAIKYLLKLMMIFVIIICMIFTYKFSISVNKIVNYIKEDITELTYDNGILKVNSDNHIFINNSEEIIQTIVIDTGNTQQIEKEHINEIETNANAIIFLKDKIVFRNEMLKQNIEYKYKDIANKYGIENFNKDDVLHFISNLNVFEIYGGFFVTMFIYMYIIYFTSTIIDILILAALGFVIARISRMRIRFKATFNMAIYALTLPILLNLVYIIVNSFTGITVKYFEWMYTTISYIYMIIAILMIKTDLINKQIELIRIVEEQEKVKEELKQQEEDKKEEEDKENKNQRDNKEEEQDKKSKKEKDNNLGKDGLAPQNYTEPNGE